MRWITVVASMMVCALAWAVEIGEKVGPLEVETLDGRALTIENYDRRIGTFFVFLSSRAQAVEDLAGDINRLHQAFRLREVLCVGIASNPEESGEELRIYAQRRGMVFPIYRDPSGAVARRLGATVMPETFLVDGAGVLLYRGALLPRDGRGGLEAAATALLEGRPVEMAHSPATGTPLGEAGPPRTVDDPYGFFWYSSEVLFDRIPGAPAHHCSTLCEAPNGDLLCLWYGGSYESAEDQVLFLARRKKDARAWDAPTVLLSNPGQPPGNAIMFKDGRGRVWVVWGRMESSRPLRRGSGWGECRLFFRTSEDSGHTWSADQEWPDTYRTLPRNVPLTLKTGEMLLPMTGESGDEDGAFFFITKDHGATWARSSVIPKGSQPTLAQRADGSLLAYLRNEPRLLQSESRDGGRTWSPPTPSPFRNPGAGVAMAQLANGHFVLVFNDDEEERTPLSITRSTDGGATWSEPLKLEANPGEYSYPCVIQTSDGRIHVSYTYRRYTMMHVEFDEGWMEHLKRPN